MNASHQDTGFFTEALSERDPELFGAITSELGRQRDEIELIASEN
ncbi:MAG: serine hydroxymethyltransferase, partial [Ruegeria pomeroyi]|nr:serine hydroxymethyltransferase [Ruegeria pomeroyi]NVK97380.1 serine hydroxymethyltransferase [Ruegeria pomeroyi]NVL02184.1 serine hydroxymethyltransferase [Ruegeria pomeroyi]NVL03015.1 serine hydroxymethyltransferase [Ruegeria pomeroyi]